MNEQIISTESPAVKPCRKCGAMDRYKSGACRVCRHASTRKYYQTNRELLIEKDRIYRQTNLERELLRVRKWRESNSEKEAERFRKYYAANREQILEAGRKYYEENPDKAKARYHNRRARKKANGGKLSTDIIQTLLSKQSNKCACCGADLMQTGYHLDHIMPLVLGGLNDDSNVQLLTPKCNLSKGVKHPDVWAKEKGITLS